MKITLEIADFDIYGSHDEKTTTFSQELKSEIIKQAAKHLNPLHEIMIRKMENDYKKRLHSLEKESLKKIDAILENYQSEVNKTIDSLRNK